MSCCEEAESVTKIHLKVSFKVSEEIWSFAPNALLRKILTSPVSELELKSLRPSEDEKFVTYAVERNAQYRRTAKKRKMLLRHVIAEGS